jgi:hypothetical protein
MQSVTEEEAYGPPTTAASFRSDIMSRGVSGGQSGTGTGFHLSLHQLVDIL